MTSEFEGDLARVGRLIDEGRRHLLEVVDTLEPGDLDRGIRGGWDIRGVLRHIIESEDHYAHLVHRLRGTSASAASTAQEPSATGPAGNGLATGADVRDELERSRRALLAAAEDVDEETFYRLGGGGSQEYSVVSVMENVHQHDEEHRAQVERIKNASLSGAWKARYLG